MLWVTLLAVLMVGCGSVVVITTKWSDRTKSVGRDGVERNFHHPFVQVMMMFTGELMCMVVYKVLLCVYIRRGDGSEDESRLTKGNRDFNPFLLYIPAVLDMTATSTMYVALHLTYASSFQMLRGAVLIFIALLSRVFLKRTLVLRQWIGVSFVTLGLAIVGFADYVSEGSKESLNRNEIIIGDVLIILAQIVAATQYVVQEQYVQSRNVPSLAAIGWEGFFGLITLGSLQVPFYFIRADRPLTQHKGDRVEDILDAFVQIGNSWKLTVAVICNLIAVAVSAYAGLGLTKELSATARKVLDMGRTIIVWMFSLAFFEQQFHWLQLTGFCMLVFGMLLYNNLFRYVYDNLWPESTVNDNSSQ